jgi:protein-S-isoprenylcysteine O-methyltransferase Ste14
MPHLFQAAFARRSIMGRTLALLYGVTAYAVFFLTFLYAIGFVGNIAVPKSIDSGTQGSLAMALIADLVLLSVFAVQHSIMARPKFKDVWTRIIPKSIERSTYVLLSSLTLVLIFACWRSLPAILFDVRGTIMGTVLQVVFWAGWLIVLTSTFMIDHFDLTGLRQVYLNLRQREFTQTAFRKLMFYRLVRHPIMTGFMIAFWATPTMTVGHLLFAAVTTAYIVVAVKYFEEKDLVDDIGDRYVAYQQDVGTFIPGVGKKR